MRNSNKQFALTLILIMAFSNLVIVKPVNAQDYYELYKPTIRGPNISVTSPQNDSGIGANFLQLIFNVTEPQIVNLSPNISPNIIENNGVRNSSDIVRVYYKGDWQTKETILYSNQDSDIEFLEFNESLSNIPNGRHQVEITAIGSIGLIVAMFGFTYHNNASTTIIFTSNSIEPTPTPTVPEFPFSVIVILIGVTIAFTFALKRRKHQVISNLNRLTSKQSLLNVIDTILQQVLRLNTFQGTFSYLTLQALD